MIAIACSPPLPLMPRRTMIASAENTAAPNATAHRPSCAERQVRADHDQHADEADREREPTIAVDSLAEESSSRAPSGTSGP